MITCEAWRGKRYAVFGLARSGVATVRALVASGAHVVGWDDSGRSPHGLWEQWKSDRLEQGIMADFRFKNWLLAKDLTGYEAVIVSPGVPLNSHPVAEKAARYGLPVIGDIELFAQARASLPPHKVVGITGTNGKSTTTALVHHILQTAGVPTTMGGNIGLPILAQAPLPEGGVYVLELSSYQIDLTHSLDCDVAVLLNVTPDHLDRYASFEAYAASKGRLFEMQSPRHFGLISTSTEAALDQWPKGENANSIGIVDLDAYGSSLNKYPALFGPHNLENLECADAVCRQLEVSREDVEEGLRTYPGLPHRMERVADRNGTLFVNDSKATNPTSTAPALAAFDAVHWILGGRAKSDDLDACAPHFGHVRAAYAIGEAAPRFVEILSPHMRVSDCGTLPVAVREAAAAARPGEVVLLSPACASFDQFSDFEARGAAFRAAVEALA